MGALVTWGWKRKESQLPQREAVGLGWGREGQRLPMGTGRESTTSGPGRLVRTGWGGVHAAAWAGLLLIEEMESQPRAPDGPRRSAACSGLGRTDLMGPEVCGNEGALSGGAVGPVPLWVPGKMLPSGAHRPKGEQVGGIRSVAHCAGRSPLLWALQDGCGELG